MRGCQSKSSETSDICSNSNDYVLTIKNTMIVFPLDKYCHNPELLIPLIHSLLKRSTSAFTEGCFTPIKNLLHPSECSAPSKPATDAELSPSPIFPKQIRWHLTLNITMLQMFPLKDENKKVKGTICLGGTINFNNRGRKKTCVQNMPITRLKVPDGAVQRNLYKTTEYV